jgi:putative endonuclease
MTWNIASRIEQHKLGIVKGFSSKYRTNMLAWCEVAESFEAAHNRDAEKKCW